jgi:hypothetical protein
MSGNPAIHRRPSGDVDIALPQDEPEATAEKSGQDAGSGAVVAGAGVSGPLGRQADEG